MVVENLIKDDLICSKSIKHHTKFIDLSQWKLVNVQPIFSTKFSQHSFMLYKKVIHRWKDNFSRLFQLIDFFSKIEKWRWKMKRKKMKIFSAGPKNIELILIKIFEVRWFQICAQIFHIFLGSKATALQSGPTLALFDRFKPSLMVVYNK